jgi:hypothetical protein
MGKRNPIIEFFGDMALTLVICSGVAVLIGLRSIPLVFVPLSALLGLGTSAVVFRSRSYWKGSPARVRDWIGELLIAGSVTVLGVP